MMFSKHDRRIVKKPKQNPNILICLVLIPFYFAILTPTISVLQKKKKNRILIYNPRSLVYGTKFYPSSSKFKKPLNKFFLPHKSVDKLKNGFFLSNNGFTLARRICFLVDDLYEKK